MANDKAFIYLQTRLQARHGQRPTEQDWRFIESQNELGSYLQSARQSCLRPWVISLHANEDYHVLESTLIQEYRNYIEEVSLWVPSAWRKAVQWLDWLIDLPALQHLLTGNTAPAWMLEDTKLKAFVLTNPQLRLQAMQQASCAPVIERWSRGTSLLDAWLQHWQQLWYDTHQRQQQLHHQQASLDKLIALLRDYLAQVYSEQKQTGVQRQAPSVSQSRHLYTTMSENLTHLFRRFRYQAVAAFIHLALVGLDLERLRGGILQRSLFPGFHKVPV